MSRSLRPPDQSARNAACDPARSVLVRAPAGSGKTGVLLLRYLHCLLTVTEPEQVVAITFTRKAAAEIRERVLQALRWALAGRAPRDDYEAAILAVGSKVLRRDAERQWSLLQNPTRLRVSTFDSFCNSLARRLPLLSGLGQIQTSDDSEALYREAILELFRSLEATTTPPELRTALGNVLDYASNRIEQLLPLLANLLGKRDQWVDGIVDADLDAMEAVLREHVAERFAALCAQLDRLGLQPALKAMVELSAHSEALAWAADLCALADAAPEQQSVIARAAQLLLTQSGALISPRTAGPAKGFTKGHAASAAIKDWLDAQRNGDASALETALAELIALPAPQLPAAARSLCQDLIQVLRYLLAQLRLVFEREGQLDFGEVAFRAIAALTPPDEADADYGDALLREDRIQHIMVDEMQDTSVSQMQLLKHLMQGWQPGDGRSLFLCGDLHQSIYLFRGALVGLFGELIEQGDFHGHGLALLQLQANFRSAPPLVAWVNGVFDSLLPGEYVPALPQRDTAGGVSVHGFVGDSDSARQAEAARAVTLIREALAQSDDSSIAVLVRSRSHLQAIIAQLKAAGIAFAGQDIDRLAQAPAVADFIALLRAWAHAGDRAAWVGLLRAPFVGMGWEDIRRLCLQRELLSDIAADDSADALLSEEGAQRLRRLRAHWQTIAAHPRAVEIRWAVPALWHSLGGPACIAAHEAADIDRVLAVLDDRAPGGYLQDIAAFERALERLYAQPAQARVELMTIHKAKGLEFDVVIVPGLGNATRGSDSPLFYWRRLDASLLLAPRPSASADDDTQKLYDYLRGLQAADERRETDRLLYVALTRAKRQLHLIGSASEDVDGEVKPRANSLLARLWPAVQADFASAPRLPSAELQDSLQTPLAPRLAVDAQPRFAPFHTAPPREDNMLDRLAEQVKQAVLEDNIEDRTVGLVYHELMRRIGGGRADVVDDREALVRAIAARLRHHCHPETGLDTSVLRVLRLTDNTLSCEHGRWILAHYRESGAEQSIRHKLGDSWQKLIVDRFFVDGDTCWIIDYKTAEGSGAAFVAAQRQRYREKMQKYVATLRAANVAAAVKAALYFPAAQLLVPIDD